MYIHEYKDWPKFRWQPQTLMTLLNEVYHIQGRLLGRMEMLGFQQREAATLFTLTQDVIKTSEIEGEKLDLEQVRSSIAKRLNIDIGLKTKINQNVEGIVEIMIDATRHYDQPLTVKRLFSWHSKLFSKSKDDIKSITVGKWRTKKSGAMQVISGPIGREKIHFEAPLYHRLKKEMSLFLDWYHSSLEHDLIIKSALAHFWFLTIHPFDDGNGRIARAIADMTLARSEDSSQRFYSMSTQIQKERKEYYKVLENCQKGSLDITDWIEWYLGCLKRALLFSEVLLEKVLSTAQFWKTHANETFNERQKLMINRLLEDFYGKLTSSKWAKITKCSQDTALRDINDLLHCQILIKDESGGRSTSYRLNKP